MPASLPSLLADALDLSEDRAATLLHTITERLRAQTAEGERIRIPTVGTFAEEDGTLAFTPAPSLAQTINQRYEGLRPERVGVPGDGQTRTADDTDRETDDGASASADTNALEAPPDTDEFEAPDTDELQAPDTNEFEAPDPGALETSDGEAVEAEAPTDEDDDHTQPDSSASADATAETPDTDDEAPTFFDVATSGGLSRPSNADDTADASASKDDNKADNKADDRAEDAAPDRADAVDKPSSTDATDARVDPAAESTTEDDDHTSLTNIWTSDEWNFSDVSEGDSLEDEDAAPSDTDETPPDSEETLEDPKLEGDGYAPDVQPKRPASTSSLSGGAIAAIGLILIGFGAVAWYVFQPSFEADTPAETTTATAPPASSSPNDGSDPAPSPATPSPEPSAPSASPSDTMAGSNPQSAPDFAVTPESTPEADAPEAEANARPSIDPSAGGWGIVVASQSSQAEAADRLAVYRDRLQSLNLPIDIVSGTSNGTTRHRIVVGQFSSRSDLQAVMTQYQDQLPPDAWPLDLKP